MMRRLAVCLGSILSMVAAAPAAAADNYGAIAFDTATGASGYSYDYSNRAGAERRALGECGRGCRVVMWFRNACGALASTPRGGWGSGWSRSRAGAERIAMRECRSAGNIGCRVTMWSCTSR